MNRTVIKFKKEKVCFLTLCDMLGEEITYLRLGYQNWLTNSRGLDYVNSEEAEELELIYEKYKDTEKYYDNFFEE